MKLLWPRTEWEGCLSLWALSLDSLLISWSGHAAQEPPVLSKTAPENRAVRKRYVVCMTTVIFHSISAVISVPSHLAVCQLQINSLCSTEYWLQIQLHGQLINVLETHTHTHTHTHIESTDLLTVQVIFLVLLYIFMSLNNSMLTFSIELKSWFEPISSPFCDSRMEQAISKWRFSQGRRVHWTCKTLVAVLLLFNKTTKIILFNWNKVEIK